MSMDRRMRRAMGKMRTSCAMLSRDRTMASLNMEGEPLASDRIPSYATKLHNLDLVDHEPDAHQGSLIAFIGFEISCVNLPHPSSLSLYIQFKLYNAYDPPPKKHLGFFRPLVICGVCNGSHAYLFKSAGLAETRELLQNATMMPPNDCTMTDRTTT
jgi:hypothetical protein